MTHEPSANPNKERALTILIVIIMVATLAFIWGNSLESLPVSANKSSRVLKAIAFILEPVFGKANVTDHLVRKIAHFVEFFWLGMNSALFMVVRKRVSLQSLLNGLFFGLSVAVMDETLQLFSGRGAQVKDILLDFSGAFSGILMVSIVYGIFRVLGKSGHADKYQ